MGERVSLPLPLLVLIEPTPALRASIARLALTSRAVATVVAAEELERIGPLAECASLVVAEAGAVAGPRPGAVAARLAHEGRLALLTDCPRGTTPRGALEHAVVIDKQHLEPALRELLARLRPAREGRR